MFRVRPTGPLVPRPLINRLTSFILGCLRQVSENGTDITINYVLPNGVTVGLTFEGAPFKGKPIAQIDAALTWEIEQFRLRMGWN